MTIIAVKAFSGEIPKLPYYMLPETAAHYALDCDFSHGDLRGLHGHFPILSGSPTSLYSVNGLQFYTWSEDVDAVRSPIAGEPYHRFYFTTPSGFFVGFDDMASVGGGEPGTQYKVGVPAPTINPVLTAVDSGNFANKATTVKGNFWYEDAGVQYQNAVLPLAQVTLGRKYTATAPAKTAETDDDEGTPTKAVAVLQLVFMNASGAELYSVTTSNSTRGASTSVVAGGLSATLSENGTALTVTLSYGVSEERAYLYTFVNQYQEESAPSEAVQISLDALQTVKVQVPGLTAPTGGYMPISKVYLYRANTASSGTAEFQFCQELSISQASTGLADTVAASALGDVLQTDNWYPPPQSLRGIVNMGNGILAAFRSNEVHFCEAYIPYAWNPFNVVTLPYAVVGLCTHAGGLVVVTSAYPYLINGVTADAMTSTRIPAIQGGVSKNAIADLGTEVVYATHDGLVVIQGNQATLELSHAFWTRKDWRERYPLSSSLRLAAHDGYVVGYFASGNGFIVRLDEATGTLTESTTTGNGAFVVPQADSLYISTEGSVSQFAGGSRKPFEWWSKDFILKKPENFGTAQVVMEAASITMDVWADGVKVYTKALSGTGVFTFRLPSGFLARTWAFTLKGTGIVKEVYLATCGVTLGDV